MGCTLFIVKVVKNKLQRFAEINSFPNVVQPGLEHPVSDHPMKGNWRKRFFLNDNPIVLEIGCGKGEYSLALADRFPDKNYLGLDIKGDRIWVGAKKALHDGVSNVGFLRAQAEHINCFFTEEEVDEIWVTFPDPQPNKPRIRKRLTSPQFLDRYKRLLKKDGIIHLKTDSKLLYNYTLEVVDSYDATLMAHTPNLYGEKSQLLSKVDESLFSVQTYYEKMFLNKGESITYIQFRLD